MERSHRKVRVDVDSSEESLTEDDCVCEDDELPFLIRHRASMSWCVLALYFATGVAMLKWQEGWEVTTAIYVVVQVVTTVGYGDVTVQNGSKIFMSLYVLTGTVLVANILNGWLERLLENADKGLDRSLKAAESKLSAGDHHQIIGPKSSRFDFVRALLTYAFFVLSWAIFFAVYEHCSCSFGATEIEGCDLGMCEETGGKMVRFGEAVYMAIITYSTVGFGDFSPQSHLGRLVASLWMILGVLSFGNLVAAVSALLQDVKESYTKKLKVSRKLFDKIDQDKSGSINQHEFLRYVLLREGKVSVELLDQIDRLFRCLDEDANGKLTFEEIRGRLLEVDEESCESIEEEAF